MKHLAAACWLVLVSCAGTAREPVSLAIAQGMVDEVTARHPELVRLTLHATPSYSKDSRVIASNLVEKLGDVSDPEDVQAMKTKQPVTLQEGANVDYTAPVVDSSGKAIAAIGVTVMGATQEEMLASAKQIAAELTALVLSSESPLW